MGDEDEDPDRLLEELLKLMEAAMQSTPPQWNHRHFNRVLFTDVSEIQKLKLQGDVYVKENYLPEYKKTNEFHPVPDVLFIGTVIKIERKKEQVWFNVEASNKHCITVVMDKKVIPKCVSNYAQLHKEFRQAQRDPATSSIDLNISEVRYILARRRRHGEALIKEKWNMLNKTILILGKVGEMKYKRCVYMKAHALLSDPKVIDFLNKNIERGRWYEALFRDK